MSVREQKLAGREQEGSAKSAAAEASVAKLLDAAVHVIRAKGYSAARVEDICAEAGLTKGAFFHHFASKEACAVAAAAHFAANADAIFDAAPYAGLPDPRARALGYVEFRKSILAGELPQFTCLLGTMVQEAYDTHPVHKWSIRSGIFDIVVKPEILEIGFGQRLLPPSEEVFGRRKLSEQEHQVECFPQVDPNHGSDVDSIQIRLSTHCTKALKALRIFTSADITRCRDDQ